jgi:hypothetical protein
MVNLGKTKNGLRIFVNDEDIIDAAQNRNKWKSDLNNQQWAKMRKLINRYLKAQNS